MPIYEYMCQSCQHKMEALQKMSDARLVDCPECGKPELKKQVTAAAFKLKGSGWYETDFKNKGQKSTASKEAGASGQSENSSKSESSSKSDKAKPSASGSSAKAADA